MKLRRLQLVAQTNAGRYGADLTFKDGLVVLRAENTSGKSTCVQAIVFALGLESMLTTRHEVPLPHAMTSYLETGQGRADVLESWVALEVEGADGRDWTLQRWARPPENVGTNLVRVWEGPALSEPDGAWRSYDRFARLAHSAESPRGLYPTIEQILGWDVPRLQRSDGTTVPLYLEMIFPLFIVEQKRGWSQIQAQMPPYGGVPEPRKRAIEFVLGLGAYERELARAAVSVRLSEQRDVWKAAVATFGHEIGRSDVVLVNPPAPSTSWPPAVRPALLVAGADGDRPLGEELAAISARRIQIEATAVPRAEQAAAAGTVRLQAAEQELTTVLDLYDVLRRDLHSDQQRANSLDQRLAAAKEDVRLNEDVRTLLRLGAERSAPSLDDHCPTCHQPVDDLSALTDRTVAATTEESLALVRDQQAAFQSLRENLTVALEERSSRLRAVSGRAAALRSEIRALRDALISPGSQPSLAVLEERVRLAARADRLRAVGQSLAELELELEEGAARIAELTAALREFPPDGLDDEDRARISNLRRALVEQLKQYGFSSLHPEEVDISEARYLPSNEGYDLGFDVSASDWIRLIWAYLLGLLEVSREGGHHAGFLIFDEPRQQDADPVSFEALLRRASNTHNTGQQVLFATSEPLESLQQMLDGLPVDLHHFDGLILGLLDP